MTHLFEIAKTKHAALLKQLHKAGIEAVSPENWLQLQSAAQLMEQPELATAKVHEQIRALKKRLLQNQSGFFPAHIYRRILHWIPLVSPIHKKWQRKQIDFFNDPLWWSRCFEKIKSLPRKQQENAEGIFHRLQKDWFLQGNYADYSTLDLIHVYQSVMPVFSEWLFYAKAELKKRQSHLPAYLLHAYQRYLTWFEQALLTEKTTLRTCLQGRLAIGLKAGNGSWDNMINAMVGELEGIGLLPQHAPLTKALAYGHLTPEAFVTIRRIIEADGTESEKKAFYNLDYHQPFEFTEDKKSESHYRFNEEGHSYFIPPSLSAAIPVNPPFYTRLPTFLHGLFWGDRVASTFFQHPHCQFLLAQAVAFLAVTPDAKTINLENLLHHPAWKQNERCLTYLVSERQRAERWLQDKPVFAFLFPSAIALLQDYQKSLHHSAEHWMMKQLAMLKHVMATKENKLLNASEKDILEKALDDLQTLQKPWRFSKDPTNELSNLTLNYEHLCYPAQDEKNPSLAVKKRTSELSVRHQFREIVAQVVYLFEATQTTPMSLLDPLKNQLNVDPALYDSVALRFWLMDFIKIETLPNELKISLQAILDQPQFGEEHLDCAENKALAQLKNRLPETFPLAPKKPFAVLDENPLDNDLVNLAKHFQAVKATIVPLSDPSSIQWQEKFSQYALRFLQQIQTLPHWEAYSTRRDQITQTLDLLIAISSTHFTALHRTLLPLLAAEKKSSADQWSLFKRIYLAVPMQALTACLMIKSTPVTTINLDAASYQSQKELAFLKPTPSTIKTTDASPSLPIPIL